MHNTHPLFYLLASALLFSASFRVFPQENRQGGIVSLSPHLTEIVFALGKQKQLLGVSDYSDYPFGQGCIDEKCSKKLPSVANYLGADIAQILRLQPSIILAWEGGNKAQDLARLEQLGFRIYRSSPKQIEDLFEDIRSISLLLNEAPKGLQIVQSLQQDLAELRAKYHERSRSAIYYMSSQPLSGMANDTWLNSLLASCGITNIYQDINTSFIQFSVADVIRKQPELVIAAVAETPQEIKAYWQPHISVFQPQLIQVNPDALHRFTPRVLPELRKLCESVHP